ncbi:hypothetical protein L6452_11644 [Arctium lappa]|uniref:Uncharacterized protein n=1 Tax=Arctium lappa TaxID=4217 RepID=A0ACB9DPZ4_ARCLA|nr:hypothetical protein L6452_11644 [Arctium lappa]
MVTSPIEGNQEFVKKLISLMSPKDLAMQDSFGQTALSGAILAVAKVKRMQELKRKHAQALVLLRRSCYLLAYELPDEKVVTDVIGSPLERAAAMGNVEAKVFNLIYQATNLRRRVLHRQDNSRNTALHLAGESENEAGLNLRSTGPGPTLQMQRELQWFKVLT